MWAHLGSSRVADFAPQGGCGDGADAGLVSQGGAVAVCQFVDETLETVDLAAGCAVLADECLQPFEAMPACWGGALGGADVFEA